MKNVSLRIDDSSLAGLHEYNQVTGVPLTTAINEAIKDFLEVVAPARMEAFKCSHFENKKKSA